MCFLSLEVEEGKGKRVVSLLLFVGVGVVVRVRGERKGNYAMLCERPLLERVVWALVGARRRRRTERNYEEGFLRNWTFILGFLLHAFFLPHFSFIDNRTCDDM